jgi:two-component system sensor histidine kinase MtrB
VRAASGAAERIAAGDLTARLDETGGDEFGTWAASFNRMAASLDATVADLRDAEARERRFVADVSHELRTPVTALVGEAALLAEHLDALPPDSRRAGELLVGDVARLRVLVDDLMEISRFDAAAEVAEANRIDLVVLVRAIAAARAPEARLELPPERVFAVTDRRRIERILVNLLDNAREHGAGAEIIVSLVAEPTAEGDAGQVTLAVEDRGPGVPAAERTHLFERVRKADPSRHAGGSGLGLAIARAHAELLGGTLDARPRDGGGLRFELHLPVTQPLPDGAPGVTGPAEAERR